MKIRCTSLKLIKFVAIEYTTSQNDYCKIIAVTNMPSILSCLHRCSVVLAQHLVFSLFFASILNEGTGLKVWNLVGHSCFNWQLIYWSVSNLDAKRRFKSQLWCSLIFAAVKTNYYGAIDHFVLCAVLFLLDIGMPKIVNLKTKTIPQ